MHGTLQDQLFSIDKVAKAMAAAVIDPQNQTALYKPVRVGL